MPKISELLTVDEIEKYFPYKHLYLYKDVEYLTIKEFINFSYCILPLIYPNGIIEKENIFGVGWHFLNSRAKQKKITLIKTTEL